MVSHDVLGATTRPEGAVVAPGEIAWSCLMILFRLPRASGGGEKMVSGCPDSAQPQEGFPHTRSCFNLDDDIGVYAWCPERCVFCIPPPTIVLAAAAG